MSLKTDSNGYTLLEVLTVVGIITIFAVIALPHFNHTLGWSSEKSDMLTLDSLNKALELFKVEHDSTRSLIGNNDKIHNQNVLRELGQVGYISDSTIEINSLISLGQGESFQFVEYRGQKSELPASISWKNVKGYTEEQYAWKTFIDESKQESRSSGPSASEQRLSPESTEEIADLIFRHP